MSFRFTVHQSERSEIRCFPGPMNVSSLFSVGRQLDRDWHSANILQRAQINPIERAREIRKLPSRWYSDD